MTAGHVLARTATAGRGQRRARRRDRRVFLAAHPVMFVALAFARRRPVRTVRLPGRPGVLVVSGAEHFRSALTDVPLDRLAEGTTGAAARAVDAAGVLFDEDGAAHRASRRAAGAPLSARGIAALATCWTEPLAAAATTLTGGGTVDAVALTRLISGRIALALADPSGAVPSGAHAGERALALADAARCVAATTAAAHLPAPPWRRRAQLRDARDAVATLRAEIAGAGSDEGPQYADRAVMLVLAAVTTTVAALPRALAWAADADLWHHDPAALATELLRVTAATPVLPRAAAADADLPDGHRVRAGDRLILIARHAARSHDLDPDPGSPQPAATARLVFGAGPHACPGANLALVMFTDALRVLAPHRPAVVAARADRGAALPSWASLELRARSSP